MICVMKQKRQKWYLQGSLWERELSLEEISVKEVMFSVLMPTENSDQ